MKPCSSVWNTILNVPLTADYDPWYLPQSVRYLIQCAIKTTVRQSHTATPSVPTASHKDVSAIKHLTEHNDSNLLPPSRPLPLSCQCFDGNVGEAALECSLAAVALTILALPVSRPTTVAARSSGIEEKLIIQPGSFSPELAHTPWSNPQG